MRVSILSCRCLDVRDCWNVVAMFDRRPMKNEEGERISDCSFLCVIVRRSMGTWCFGFCLLSVSLRKTASCVLEMTYSRCQITAKPLLARVLRDSLACFGSSVAITGSTWAWESRFADPGRAPVTTEHPTRLCTGSEV